MARSTRPTILRIRRRGSGWRGQMEESSKRRFQIQKRVGRTSVRTELPDQEASGLPPNFGGRSELQASLLGTCRGVPHVVIYTPTIQLRRAESEREGTQPVFYRLRKFPRYSYFRFGSDARALFLVPAASRNFRGGVGLKGLSRRWGSQPFVLPARLQEFQVRSYMATGVTTACAATA